MTTSNYFAFSAAWPKIDDDVAEISLRVGDRVISRIADTDKQTVRDYFRASSTSLAFWLADNWWRLRWETIKDFKLPSVDWRLRHELMLQLEEGGNTASLGSLEKCKRGRLTSLDVQLVVLLTPELFAT